MKLFKKALSLFVMTCLITACVVSMTACFGGKSDFQKMFDDLGTNFCFAGGEGVDEIDLMVDEDGLKLIVGGGEGWQPLGDNTYTNTMYIKKTANGYARYKRIARVYGSSVVQTNEYTPAEAVSEAEYKQIIKNALLVYLMPLADYENNFVLKEEIEEHNTQIYYADQFSTAKFKVDGIEYTNTYSDIGLNVVDGKLAHVSYILTVAGPERSSTGSYYYDRNSGSFDFPSQLN